MYALIGVGLKEEKKDVRNNASLLKILKGLLNHSKGLNMEKGTALGS